MIVMLSAGRLKPGAWEQFRRAWYRAWRESADAEEPQRVDRLSALVANEYVSGVYEVIDTLDS
jgi:hypothetical protein